MIDYRGASAFSEPETQAVKDLLEKLPNVKMALNFHAWGPLWIYPFMFDSEDNQLLEKDYSKALDFYKMWSERVDLANGMKTGNAMQTIGYRANGEASDWMLAA